MSFNCGAICELNGHTGASGVVAVRSCVRMAKVEKV